MRGIKYVHAQILLELTVECDFKSFPKVISIKKKTIGETHAFAVHGKTLHIVLREKLRYYGQQHTLYRDEWSHMYIYDDFTSLMVINEDN